MPEITEVELSWMKPKPRRRISPAVMNVIMFTAQLALMSAAFGTIMLLIAVLN